jgi:hypothetical protein
MAELKKGSRITGAARDNLGSQLAKKYEKGTSIRALAQQTGRSYGFIHLGVRRDTAWPRRRHPDEKEVDLLSHHPAARTSGVPNRHGTASGLSSLSSRVVREDQPRLGPPHPTPAGQTFPNRGGLA